MALLGTSFDVWCSQIFYVCCSFLCVDKFSSNNTNKRQKLAQDFLNSIDQTGELLAMFEDDEIDDVKQERMEVILMFYWYPSPTEKTLKYFIHHAVLLPFFVLHIVSLLHVFSFCPDGQKESYFHIFPIPSNVCWYVSTHAEREDYESGVMDISVCHLFVFPSRRKQILFKNISQTFFSNFFLFFILSLIGKLCLNSNWGFFSYNIAFIKMKNILCIHTSIYALLTFLSAYIWKISISIGASETMVLMLLLLGFTES